jgi:BirA family transcriptional regulator, biotin operon repressor / biotin---[acetyl-CoA-carboxylase] ligase
MFLDRFLFEYIEQIDSTNTYLKQKIKEGIYLNSIILAKHQLSGRGRGDNSWVSPKGGIYLSLSFPVKNDDHLYLIGPSCAVLLSKWIQKEFNVKTQIKWPNDLLFENKKLAGLLLEIVTNPENQKFIVIGLGLNVETTPVGLSPNSFLPVTLGEILNKKTFDLENMGIAIAEVLSELENFDSINKDELLKYIQENSATLGKEIKIVAPGNKILYGKAVKIGSDFNLYIENDGLISKVGAGDCYHVREIT